MSRRSTKAPQVIASDKRTSKEVEVKARKAVAPKPTSTASNKSASSPERYSDPELREAIKADVLAGSKGGRPGQWSARKAQLVATEYKRRGGGYLGGPRTATQKRIQKWDGA